MPFNKRTQCYLVFAKPSVTLPILVEEYQIMVNRPFNICLVIFRFNLDGFIYKMQLLIKNVVNYVDFDVTNMKAIPDATSRRLILTSDVSTAIVWRNHCVRISCTYSTAVILVKSSQLCVTKCSSWLNVCLNPCRSSPNIVGSIRKKFLKESFSRKIFPQWPNLFFQHLAQTSPATCEVLPPFPL